METQASRQVRRGRGDGQSGMALLLTLGFLCVLLMLVLSLAIATRADRRSAAAGVDRIRSELAAQSALAEVESRLRRDYANVRYPADRFYVPGVYSSWAGRRYLASGGNGVVTAGITEALAVELAGREFTPARTLTTGVGWLPVLSTQTVRTSTGLTTQNTVIGRYAYVVIDESGRIDPSAVVSRGITEETATAVTGASLSEICLTTLGFSDADRFLPASQFSDVLSGNLPDNEQRWFSWPHLARALNFTQTEMDLAKRTLFHVSRDQEQFWRDRNNNGTFEYGELADRLDLHASLQLSQVYHTFVGPLQDYSDSALDASADDCAWLKRLDDNPWFVAWKNTAFAAYPEPSRTTRARSLVAARTAANIVDYADPDSSPTLCYLDSAGQIHSGVSNSDLNAVGTERTWGLSQVAMRVDTDVTVQPVSTLVSNSEESSSTDEISFDIRQGLVIPGEQYEVKLTVLGSNIVAWDTTVTPAIELYTAMIGAAATVGGSTVELGGSLDDPAASNLNDGRNPRHFLIPGCYPAGTPISLQARYWYHPYNADGTINYGAWAVAEDLSTETTPKKALILKDGSPVPPRIAADEKNGTLVYYLEEYVENGKISLQANQAIVLFETIAFASPRVPDYQDLAILITMNPIDEVPTRYYTESHTVDGFINLNPSNATAVEFTLVTPNGDITRDDLHVAEVKATDDTEYFYKGAWSEMRVKTKGQSITTINVDGQPFTLEPNQLYVFTNDQLDIGDEIAIRNTEYDSKGRATGQWIFDIPSSTGVTISADGNIYASIDPTWSGTPTSETTTVILDDSQADPTDYGDRLRIRAGFQVELYYPWCENAQAAYPPSSVEISYKVVVGTNTNQELVCRGSKTVAIDSFANADGGTIARTSVFNMDGWAILDNAFDTIVEPPVTGYTVKEATIETVVVKDYNATLADLVPISGNLYTAAATTQSLNDESFYCALTPPDAVRNDSGGSAPDFSMMWTVVPSDGSLDTTADAALAGFGTVDNSYNSGSYAGICVPNSLILRLGELGRVHSFQPNRSLRLWAATSADEHGHDADILDVFKIGPQAVVNGRVNINSLQPAVLKAIFTGALDADVDAAVAEILLRRAAGRTFVTVGEVLGGIACLTPGTGTLDAVAEQAAVRLAEKLTTRPNYFTVIVTAQAIKDVAGVAYKDAAGSTTTAAYGVLDVTKTGRLVDQVQAEQKLMATVYRDGLTGEVTRVQWSPLNDE